MNLDQDELRAYASRSGGSGAGGSASGEGGSFSSRGRKDPLTDPHIEAAIPVKPGEKTRFFVIRSLNHDNLAVSVGTVVLAFGSRRSGKRGSLEYSLTSEVVGSAWERACLAFPGSGVKHVFEVVRCLALQGRSIGG